MKHYLPIMKLNRLHPLPASVAATVALALIPAPLTFAEADAVAEAETPAAETTEDTEEAAPESHTVETEEFEYNIHLDGTLMPKESAAIVAAPDRFTTLRITSILPNATAVKKGDSIVQFDLTKLDKQIESYEKTIAEKEVAFALAQSELSSLEKLTPIQMTENQRAVERAKDDFKYLVDTKIPVQREAVQREVVGAERTLAYNNEELVQLEKMYTDDDFTEETEEMMLKRTRWSVEGAEFRLKRAKLDAERTLEVTIPRQLKDSKEAVEKSEIRLERAKIDLPASLESKKLTVAGLAKELVDYKDALAELKQDAEHLAQMTAPMDGVLLYGDWTGTTPPSNVADVARRLNVGSSFAIHATNLTVAGNTPGTLAVSVPEHYRNLLDWDGSNEKAAGSSRYATLKAANGSAFAVGLREISPTLQADKSYAAILDVDTSSEVFAASASPAARPGMHTSVSLVDYDAPEAIVIPNSLIEKKFENGKLVRFVPLLNDDGSTTEQPVTYSRATKEKAEILTGLKAGDQIAK